MGKFFVDIKDSFWSFIEGIQNLIRWFPVIWKDRDFDDYYLYAILEKKLKTMGDLQHKYGHTVNSEDIAEQLYYASGLAHRYNHHDYSADAEWITGYTQRYGEKHPKLVFGQRDKNGLVPAHFEYVDDKQKKLSLDSADLADDLQESDRQELFDFLKEHSNTWWD